MVQYKTVAGPVGLTITRKESYTDAVKQYASIIDKEAVGGWKLDCIQSIPVTQTAGCMAGLFGAKDVTVYFNMLVFVKEE
jgi:predicted secreted protein